ncbi:MAG: radical SAM protein [Candidatus Omnitrophota bacterium]|nr:radical SAM protein [Candidatus Omnitrophota bacterium]
MKIRKSNYKKSLPEIISFLVTNRCVCHCRHCFNWFEANPKGAIGNSKKLDLTADEISRIFSNLGPIEYLYVAGGEPFIRKDLCEVLQNIYEFSRPKTINISTNGQIIDNTIVTVDNFLKGHPEVRLIIKVSIDGIAEDHDAIRNTPGAFARAISVYQSLMRLKDAHKKLKVGINTVFSSLNQDKIFDIYEYFCNLKPRPDCMAQLLVRDEPRDQQCKQGLKLDTYKRWTDLYVRDMVRGKFEHDSKVKIGTIMMYDYIYKTIIENKSKIPCYAGISGGFIDNEGMVGACEHTAPFGSLREYDYDFKKIWNSDQAGKIREKIFDRCFCTNEPQWWHPTILYSKKISSHSIRLIKVIISVLAGKWFLQLKKENISKSLI